METDTSLKTAKILTASKLTDRFLETKIYEPTDPSESIYGNAYIIIEVTTPWFPTAKITKLIRNTFLEEYYRQSLNRAESKRFEDGLKAVNKQLSDLAGAGQIEWINNLNAIIAVINNRRLYLSHTGTAEAYLFRDNKISHITSGEDVLKNPTPIQTFSALINGDLEIEDRLVLSNSEMYNFVSIDTLRNAINQISPNGAVDEIANILFREKADKVNAIFIYFSSENQLTAKAATASPDTIFLDSPEAAGTLFKFGFKPKNALFALKRGIISLGFLVIAAYNSLRRLFKRKNKDELAIRPEKLEKEPKKDLSYMTSSIDINLSHLRDKTKKTNGANFLSVFGLIFSWLKGLNKKWLYGGLAFLIILSVSLGIYYKFHQGAKTEIDLSAIVASAQEKINSAETQAALHNDEGAKSLLLEAKAELEGIKDKPKSPVEVIILLDKIQADLDKINKISQIENPKQLTDFSGLASNLKAENLIYSNGALYAINSNSTELLVAIADKGDNKILTKISGGKIESLSSFGSEQILILAVSDNKIYEYNLKTSKLEEKPNAGNTAYPNASALGTYLSTLYILDKNEGAMQKFSPSGAGYDKGRDVFKASLFNLKDINSFAIDGNIYLLFDNGEIKKTLKGSIDTNFQVKNIPAPNSTFDSPNQIWTSVDSTSIYVLENGKHRVVELNKNGDYLRQSVFKDSIGEINSISINEKAKKLYLLSDNKIFEIDL